MSGNQKDWRWCERGRHWVFDFPLPAGLRWCDACYVEWVNQPKERAEAKSATEYLERDYAATAC